MCRLNQPPSTLKASLIVSLLFASVWTPLALTAGDEPATYSDAVVAKAEEILAGVDLRRSGARLQSTAIGDLARKLSALNRKRRELRMAEQACDASDAVVAKIRNQLRRLNANEAQLSLQLANVAGVSVRKNNQLVGLINANRAQQKEWITRRNSAREEAQRRRSIRNQLETEFADSVLSIRQAYDELVAKIDQDLADADVKTAIAVLHRNFDVPRSNNGKTILSAVDARLAKIEQQIFREEIALEVDGGGLYVNVSVGDRAVRMVVDSGASLVSLPQSTADQLGITIPDDAPELVLKLADGRQIPGRGVVLAKVRVGEFEATDVRAAILGPTAVNAKPLLGLSYLANFKFEIDPASRTLNLLRVDSDP